MARARAKAKPKAKSAKQPSAKSSVDPKYLALRDAVWADPDDHQAITVWADYLVDHGDARGELSQLNLNDDGSDEQRARRTEIIKQHRVAWFGRARPFGRGQIGDAAGR